MEKVNKIKVYSYSKVWKMENKMYAIQNLVLPVPIKPQELLYFLIVAGVVFVLSAIFPFFLVVPSIIRYAVIPYGVTQFLLKKKLDGKPPQKYLVGYVKHLFTKGEYIERFQSHTDKMQDTFKISWICGSRDS